MNIGIIGSGNMGSGLGKLWANHGHKILFSYTRDLHKLKGLAKSIGPNTQAGTPAEAAQFGEVVLLCVPWIVIDDALQATGSLAGKILIDCTMPLAPALSSLLVGHTISGSEVVAKKVPQARVVRAFNTTFAEVLNSEARTFCSKKAAIFYCGDDEVALAVVADLIRVCGFEAVDAGPLVNSRYIESLAMLWMQFAYFLGMGSYIGVQLLQR